MSGKDIRYKDAVSVSQGWNDEIRTYSHTFVTDAGYEQVEDSCEDGSAFGPNLYGDSYAIAAFHNWAVGFTLVNT